MKRRVEFGLGKTQHINIQQGGAKERFLPRGPILKKKKKHFVNIQNLLLNKSCKYSMCYFEFPALDFFYLKDKRCI